MGASRSGSWLKKGYWGFVQSEKFIGHFLLLGIRLYWGVLLVMAGAGKWMNIDFVGQFFSSLNIPYPQVMAYVVATIELLGGISLIFGLLTRFFALLLTCVFITAFATAHHETLFNLKAMMQVEAFLYLYAALVVLCFGPGLFSVDYWVEKKSFGEPL